MIRKFAVASLVALSAFGSSIVLALGLGEVKVNSTLNQPLDAEIQLVNVRDLNANEILPSLASREDFERAGVDRVFFLQDLHFKVEFKGANTAVIKLTTTKAVREPFINFLIEVVWPSGRLLREYALLVDPPSFSEERPSAVQPARSTTTAATAAPAQAAAPVPSYTQPSQSMAPSQASSSQGGTYGPVKSTDTLWNIAAANRPGANASTQQTMLAIQDLNPEAFIDNNINRIRAGQVLRLPTLDDVQKRDQSQAVSEVRTQNRAFAEQQALGRKQLEGAKSTEQAGAEQGAAKGDVLKIVVAKGEGSAATKSAQAGGGKPGAASGTGDTANQLAVTQEKLDKVSRDNQDLQSRLKDLESQLQTAQRLLQLKDDQLAAVQGQAAKTQAANDKTTPATEPQQTAPAQPGPSTTAAQTPAVAPPTPAAPATTPAQPAASTEQPAATPAAPATTAMPAKPEVANTEKPATPAPKETKPAKAPATHAQEPGLVEQLMSNPLYQVVAAGGIVVVLALLWFLSRHNAKKEQDFHQQFAGTAEEEDILDLGATPVAAAAAGAAAAAAIGSERGQGEGEDALAEADIYIAYGRLDQAAKILEDGLENNPESVAMRSKLLDVYAQSGNTGAFDQHLAVLRDSGDEAAIAKAEQMRAEMPEGGIEEEPAVSLDDLENQLLSGRTSAPAQSSAEDEFDENEFLIDQDELESAEEPKDFSAAMEDEVASLDDEFATLDSEEETNLLAEDADKDNLDIDFDIGELDLESLEETGSKTTSTADADLNTIEFESPLTDAASGAEGDLGEGLAEEDLTSDFDLSQVDDSTRIQPAKSAEEDELDLGDLDLESSAAAATDSELADLGDLDFSEELTESLAEESAESAAPDLSSPSEEELTLDSYTEDAAMDLSETEDMSLDMEEEPHPLEESDLSSELDLSEEAVGLSDELQESSTAADLEESDLMDLEAEDLSAMDLDSEEESLVAEDETALEDTAAELSDAEIDQLESGATQAESTEFDADLEEEDFDFLAGTDEAATKLDLARAYIDMGDTEGARDILEEVAQEGSDQQKQEASDLLKSLA